MCAHTPLENPPSIAMPLNLKIMWGAGASSARLLGLDDGTTLAELKDVIASKTSIEANRFDEEHRRYIIPAYVWTTYMIIYSSTSKL